MKHSPFLSYILEDVFSEIKGVTARAMFGGYGLYKEGVIFGIIVDETLYFKTDASNRADYEREGSRPFCYESRNGKTVAMSYWGVPAGILEDRDKIQKWVEKACAIPRKGIKAKSKNRRK